MCRAVTVCGAARSCARNSPIRADPIAEHRVCVRMALARGREMLLELVSRTPTLTARLSAATAALQDLGLFAGRVSWLDYRLGLVRLYGFHASVEAALTAFRPLAGVVPDAG